MFMKKSGLVCRRLFPLTRAFPLSVACRGSTTNSHKEDDLIIEDYVDYKPAAKPRLPKYNVSSEFLEKGRFGVEELVLFLKQQNARNMFVCQVSPELRYVDHIVICSGLSNRHNVKVAEAIRFTFKKKLPNQETNLDGVKSDSNGKWIAMDLGNIALHIMNGETRDFYDLETLWAVGPELSSLSFITGPAQ